MSISKPHSSRVITRKVVGLVVLVPLLFSLIKLPFLLALTANLLMMGACVYGFWCAVRCGSRKLATFAGVMTLLNMASLITLSQASALKGAYTLVWVYVYPYYANWVYWNF